MKIVRNGVGLLCFFFILGYLVACGDEVINAIHHPSFNDDGSLCDTLSTKHFMSENPVRIKFYIEASGSMNGFFRANKVTDFKHDVWSIFSDFEKLLDNIYVFEQQNALPQELNLQTFKRKMSGGEFVSSASTEVPSMLEIVINSLDFSKGESAVLVSDMKYSPVGSKTMEVKLSQYASDVRNLVMKHGDLTLSLVAATSDYLAKDGSSACKKSPYYYLIIGKAENVVWLKNCIATILKDNKRYVDAIDWGIDYQSPAFDLVKIDNGFRLDNAPTITDIDEEYSDTCSFNIVIDMKNYPWKMVEDGLLKDSLSIKSVHGSTVKVDTIAYQVKNHANKQLEREAKAIVTVKVSDMFDKADVIEWSFAVSEAEITGLFSSFLGAKSEQELDKTFSLESFIRGCYAGKATKWCEEPNRILLSKIKQ